MSVRQDLETIISSRHPKYSPSRKAVLFLIQRVANQIRQKPKKKSKAK